MNGMERDARLDGRAGGGSVGNVCHIAGENCLVGALGGVDRKSTHLNSSHVD